MTTLDAKVPAGPIQDKWTSHRFDSKLVNPANKRKYEIIIIGTGPGDRTVRAASLELQAAGARRIVEVTGGMIEWGRSNLPLSSAPAS